MFAVFAVFAASGLRELSLQSEANARVASDPAVRVTPVYDPPMLAGQVIWGPCSGGFYARKDARRVRRATSTRRLVHRVGKVVEKGDHTEDVMRFPCMIAADIHGGRLGFTPLAEGLEQLGLELCTTPNCGLMPPH